MERMRPKSDNAAQIEYWNGPAGEKWARLVDEQELMLGHLGLAAMDACDIRSGHAVLDVGCGSGVTSFQLASRVGDDGQVLGLPDPHDALLCDRREYVVVIFLKRDVCDLRYMAFRM